LQSKADISKLLVLMLLVAVIEVFSVKIQDSQKGKHN